MILKVKKLNIKAKLPLKMSSGASGFDLYACLDNPIQLLPQNKEIISTGLAFQIPKGYELQIRSRSGLAAKYSISVLNQPGTIDCDYIGEVKIILFNHGTELFEIKNEDRIAQLVPMKVPTFTLEEIFELSETKRGSNGFGSTGK